MRCIVIAKKSVPEFLKDSDVSFDFYKNLGLGYLFTIICAYSQFKHSYKESNFNYTTEEI